MFQYVERENIVETGIREGQADTVSLNEPGMIGGRGKQQDMHFVINPYILKAPVTQQRVKSACATSQVQDTGLDEVSLHDPPQLFQIVFVAVFSGLPVFNPSGFLL